MDRPTRRRLRFDSQLSVVARAYRDTCPLAPKPFRGNLNGIVPTQGAPSVKRPEASVSAAMSGIAPGAFTNSTRAPATGCPPLCVTPPVMSAGYKSPYLSRHVRPGGCHHRRSRPPETEPRPTAKGRLSLPRDHVVVYLVVDSRRRVRRGATVGVNPDPIAGPVNDPVDRAAALAAGRVDVVIDLSAVHRGDLPSVIPLCAAASHRDDH